MGQLIYAGSTSYEIEDRMLCHVKAVLAVKLRRGEGCMLSWAIDADRGSGRVALWVCAAIPLEFKFAGSRIPPLNPEWVEAMIDMANSSRGLVLVSEADATRAVRGHALTRA